MWRERTGKINFLVLCMFACFPVLNMKVTVALIIALTVISVLSGMVWGLHKINKTRIWEVILLLSLFLFIFFRTFIIDRSENALFYLEVSMSLLAFPAAFFMTPFDLNNRQRNVLNLLFVLSTMAIVCFGEFKSAVFLYENLGPGKKWTSLGQLMEDPSFAYHFRTIFEISTGIHPTYACLFIGISILLTLDYLLKSFRFISDQRKIILIILILVLLLLQVQLASRTPFAATMMGSLVLLFSNFRKKIYAVYTLGALVILSIFLMLMVPAFSLRIREISFSNTNMPTAQNENSFNIRLGIIKCSTKIIRENWIWGVGPGNVQPHLNECYDKISKSVYENKNYNSHNQFLDYWAGLGIIGPILLLGIMIYTSVKNYQLNFPVVMCLSLLFLVAMLTENLLNRQNGIVAFSYFTSLYFFNGSYSRQKL